MSGLSHRPDQIYHLWKFTLGGPWENKGVKRQFQISTEKCKMHGKYCFKGLAFNNLYQNQLIKHKNKSSYLKTKDQWSCKGSPDYFPGITTTVRCEKGATSIFYMLKSSYISVVPDRTWSNFEIIQALMYVIVTCKYEKDLIKNS